MSIFKKSSVLTLVLLAFILPLTSIQCTSSEDDTSVLEDELESLESGVEDGEIENLDDLSDLSDADLEDVVKEEGGLGDTDEFAEEQLEGDLDGELSGLDDEFGSGTDEFAEFEDEEFGGGGDDEFAEFEDIEDFDSKGQGDFSQSEASLAKEINGDKPMNDYPVADNAQPQFPEEIMGSPSGGGMTPPPGGAMGQAGINPPGQPLITSETTDISVADVSSEPQVPQEDLGIADPILPDDDFEADSNTGQNWIPVVKIKQDPFFRNERLINAVYIARPGDDVGTVSTKIYNEDKTKEILEDNPHLSKGMDPGDKVYYNSPNRPDDRSALKVYYADVGLPPQYYKTEKDDNMRRLGSKLLGFADGWKEVWAINPQVDSKTILPAGVELKYWTGHEQKQELEMAAVEPEKVEETAKPMEPAPVEQDDFNAGVDESSETAMGTVKDPFDDGNLPPEPPLPEAQIAMPEPEPVPDIEPFPEEGLEETPGPVAGTASQSQDSSLFTVGALALLVLAGVGLVAIQIKRRKDATGVTPQSLEYTQV